MHYDGHGVLHIVKENFLIVGLAGQIKAVMNRLGDIVQHTDGRVPRCKISKIVENSPKMFLNIKNDQNMLKIAQRFPPFDLKSSQNLAIK